MASRVLVEHDDLRVLLIQVRLVIIIVLNRLPWLSQFPNVHSGSSSVIIQELRQLRQVVCQVVTSLNQIIEFLNLFFLGLLLLLGFLFLYTKAHISHIRMTYLGYFGLNEVLVLVSEVLHLFLPLLILPTISVIHLLPKQNMRLLTLTASCWVLE